MEDLPQCGNETCTTAVHGQRWKHSSARGVEAGVPEHDCLRHDVFSVSVRRGPVSRRSALHTEINRHLGTQRIGVCLQGVLGSPAHAGIDRDAQLGMEDGVTTYDMEIL